MTFQDLRHEIKPDLEVKRLKDKLHIAHWEECCNKRCAILHCEPCPDHADGLCKFPDTDKAKEIVKATRMSMIKNYFEIKPELNICDYCNYRDDRVDDDPPCSICENNANVQNKIIKH